MKERKIYNNLYWLRAIACLSVVLIHAITITFRNFDGVGYEYARYFQLLLMYATPSFVIISEFLIASAYKENLPTGFFKQRIKVLLAPYVSIGLIFAIIFSNGFNDFILRAFKYIVLADSIAYFVIIIMQFYILHYFLAKHLSKIKPIIYLSLAFIVNVMYLIFFKVVPIPNIIGFNYIFSKGYFILFPAWLFYFSLGYFLGTNYEKIKQNFSKNLKWYVCGLILTSMPIIAFRYLDVMTSISSKRFDMLLYTAFFVMTILAIFHKSEEIPVPIKLINKFSFNIYLVHAIPLNLITKSITGYFWLDVALLFVIGITVSIVVSSLLQRTKYGYLIVGKPLKIRESNTLKKAS